MSYTYNADNEQVSVTDAASDTTKYAYDGDGNQTSTTDPAGNTTTSTFDGQNRLLSTTDALGNVTSYAYNLAGWQTAETDPDKNATQYGYNIAGEMTSETNPLGYQETFGYDKAGELTGQTDFNGQQTQYTYNEAGWKTGETWLNSQNQPIYQANYAYNNAGELTSEQDPNSIYNYSYNSDGSITQDEVTYPGVSSSPLVTLNYGYNGFGERSSLSDSLGGSISYTYNGEHQLTGESFALNGTQGPQVSFAYDSMERLSSISRSDGTGSDTIISDYSYDNASRLTNITYTDLTKSLTLANYTYGYNSASQITSYQDASSSLSYGYDKTGQLASASGTLNNTNYSGSWTYDANGNRNVAGYQTGTGNELLSDGTYNYTYDKNGNTLTKTNIATGDVWYYTWNYHNQMTEAVEKTKAGLVENDEKYTYDMQGRLISVNINGVQQRWTVFDGTNAYIDFNGAGTSVTERYMTNPASYGTLYARISGTGTANWYVTDNLGSIRLILDTGGNVLDALVYDPWGNIVSESNAANGDRFKFASGQYDSMQQSYLFMARWDNPQDGRWESLDPLGLQSNSNPYRFTDNSPVIQTDPSGLETAADIVDGWLKDGFKLSGGKLPTNPPLAGDVKMDVTAPSGFFSVAGKVKIERSWNVIEQKVIPSGTMAKWSTTITLEDSKKFTFTLQAGGKGGPLSVTGSFGFSKSEKKGVSKTYGEYDIDNINSKKSTAYLLIQEELKVTKIGLWGRNKNLTSKTFYTTTNLELWFTKNNC